MIDPELVRKVEENRDAAAKSKAQRIEMRVRDAHREIKRLVEAFRREDPELGRIVLFGSLARGIPRRPDFDIDLSFEGREYYRCVTIALDSPFKVDLVDYRVAADHIRREIDQNGVVVYEP